MMQEFLKRSFLSLNYYDDLTFNSFLFKMSEHFFETASCIFLKEFGQFATYTALPVRAEMFPQVFKGPKQAHGGLIKYDGPFFFCKLFEQGLPAFFQWKESFKDKAAGREP